MTVFPEIVESLSKPSFPSTNCRTVAVNPRDGRFVAFGKLEFNQLLLDWLPIIICDRASRSPGQILQKLPLVKITLMQEGSKEGSWKTLPETFRQAVYRRNYRWYQLSLVGLKDKAIKVLKLRGWEDEPKLKDTLVHPHPPLSTTAKEILCKKCSVSCLEVLSE